MLAEAAGFKALYLGGGSTGYIECGTEDQLSLTETAIVHQTTRLDHMLAIEKATVER